MYLKYASFSLISLVFLAISTSVQGQDGNKNKSNETFSKANISKIQGTHFTARVSLDPNSKSITVQIPNQKVVNKNDNDNNKNDDNNNKPKNSKSKNGQNQAAQAQAKQIQMLKSMKVVTEWVEVEIPIKETTKIRTKTPLQVYDDKGNIKKYSPEELKTLKGSNPNLPGYEVKIDELTPGAVVEVTLNKSPANKDDKKDDDKVFATMIMVIGKDATFKPPVDNSKNKKK
ncbi:MAG: hypothetical protein JHD09_01580 [Gemmataceae bacterium]|nr:hypothetical protein [Gemmataceae bacterium]MBJ7343954.1 hypothetical protein [Gemmataceae bacterium]